jgi:hypothetical protein
MKRLTLWTVIAAVSTVAWILSGCGGGGGGNNATPAVQSCSAYPGAVPYGTNGVGPNGYVNGAYVPGAGAPGYPGGGYPGSYPGGYPNQYNAYAANGAYNGTPQQYIVPGTNQIVTCIPTSNYYGATNFSGINPSAWYGGGFQPLGTQGNCALYGPTWQAVALPNNTLACASSNYIPQSFTATQQVYYYGPSQIPVYAYQTCGFGFQGGCNCGRPGISGGLYLPGLQLELGYCH